MNIRPIITFSLVLSLFLGLLASGIPLAFAQETTPAPSSQVERSVGIDVTNVYTVTDQNSVDGDIMINSGEGIKKATEEYDSKIFGVYEQNPLVVFRNVDGSGVPIARSGIVTVNVTDLGGQIKKGDFITSSKIAGKGMKATQSGYVIGSALSDFDTNSASQDSSGGKQFKVGQVNVALRIEYAEIGGSRAENLNALEKALITSVKTPEQFMRLIRYLAAVIVLLATAALSYLVFARSISNGIQAVGRNPLAKRSIQTTIILNIIFSSIIIILGIIASFVLLRA